MNAQVSVDSAHTVAGDIPWGRAGALRIYAHLYAGQQWRLVLSGLIYIVKHSPAVLLPVITGLTIDALSSGADFSQVWFYALGAALLIAQNLPGHFFHVLLLSQAVRKVERELRSALSQRIQQLSIGYTQRQNPSALQTRMLRDVESIEQMTRALSDGVLGAGSAIAVALIATALRVPQFLLLFLVTVPLACALIMVTQAHLAARNRGFRHAIEGMSARVGEMTQLLPLTRAHALERYALERVEDSFERVSQEGLALDSVNAWFNGMAWVCFQALNALCLFAAAWAYHTQAIPITLGDVVLLSGFFTSLTNSVLGMANMLPQVSRGLEAIHSIGELMQSPDLEHNEGKLALDGVVGSIVFEQVGYRYPEAPRDALQGITLAVEPGETIALVGPSGSGKSTLANQVIGLLRPTQGRIRLDGHDMQTLDLRTWRQHLSVVPQDCVLFEGSLRDNVTFGLGRVGEDHLHRALHDAYCDEFISNLPYGVDTLIGGEGGQLSGGQRQRLAIARALVRDPRVLVLDEASSALDSDSERHVQMALERLRRGRTTFVIAHRMSTVQHADRILVMEQGRIVDSGAHPDLLARCELYARLCSGEIQA
jgi:ATP-binding cassette subfamily B protein